MPPLLQLCQHQPQVVIYVLHPANKVHRPATALRDDALMLRLDVHVDKVAPLPAGQAPSGGCDHSTCLVVQELGGWCS